MHDQCQEDACDQKQHDRTKTEAVECIDNILNRLLQFGIGRNAALEVGDGFLQIGESGKE